MQRLIGIAIACLLAGVSTAAFAQEGYVTGNVNLRAGPDIDYPAVDVIPVGSPVGVQGCTEGYEWCDVVWAQDRGWVAGNYIQYDYNDQPVLLSGYGAAIGIPIVGFVIGDYWGRYYHNRPFYAQRESWYHRPYFHHEAPRPFGGPIHDYGREHGHVAAAYAGHGPAHSEYHGGAQAQHYNGAVQHNSYQAQHNNAPAQHNSYQPQHNNAQVQHNNAPVQHNNPQPQQHNAPVQHSVPAAHQGSQEQCRTTTATEG